MKIVSSFQQSGKQNEEDRKKLYIKIAEELIGSVKQKKLQIDDLLNKQHRKMCHMQFNEESANVSLNKLGRVLRLMKIVCKIIIESNPKHEITNLINPETLKQRQVKKSEYTEESQQLENSILQEALQNKDFQELFKRQDLVRSQNHIKEGLEKILSRVSSIYEITQNQKLRNILKIRQEANVESIEKLEKLLNNQKRLNTKRYKSMIKVCIKSLCMVTSLLKNLSIDSGREYEEICSIANQFNEKYHQEDRVLDSQELKIVNEKVDKIYINLSQKYKKSVNMGH